MERGRASNFEDLLKRTPGLFLQTDNGTEVTRVSIRGSGILSEDEPLGVQFMLDGLTLNQGDGEAILEDFDLATISLPTTPVEIGAADVTAGPGGVTLRWLTGGQAVLAPRVERREAATDFAAIGEPTADGTGDLTFVDATVSPGGRYAYRLAWFEATVRRTTSEVWVDVPVMAFTLRAAPPNPASEGVFVSLALPDAAPATLELLDVAGRRLAERQVEGAGEHPRVNVSEGVALVPGIYLVRLTQGARSLTTRVTVVR
jgi:hypothetical protein